MPHPTYNRITLACDFLMTRPRTQAHHLRWFAVILGRALRHATGIEPSTFISDGSNRFSRDEFFSRSDIALDNDATHFHYNPSDLHASSVKLVSDIFKDTLVIGYELSEETRTVLDLAGVPYIDIWLHPIRFLDDNFFAYRSNIDSINRLLQTQHVPEETYYLYADRLKIQSFMGWDKYSNRVTSSIIPGSALFVGQTLTDKAVCRAGKMLNILDFKEDFASYCESHSHVYFSRHPLINGDDSDQVDFIRSFSNASITNEESYRLLSTDSISTVFGISSSVVYEARFFGKETSYLYRPAVRIFDAEIETSGYYSVFGKLHSPKFWATLLGTSPHSTDYDFLTPHSNYRDMLGLYYNTHVFDRTQWTFQRARELETAKPKKVHSPKSRPAEHIKGHPNEQWMARVAHAIERSDVISFDVFDTLVERNVMLPGDVVRIVSERAAELGISEKSFYEVRRHAKRLSQLNECPLDQRYEIVGRHLGLSDQVVSDLLSLEYEIERAVLVPRTFGQLAFHQARTAGKRVVVTSDTYFDREFIASILSEVGEPDAYYLSSEQNATKETGALFDVLSANEKGTILHVGDNWHSDFEMARRHGINAIHIQSAFGHVRTALPKFVQGSGRYSKIRDGIVVRHMANFPAVTSDPGYTSGRPEALGFNVLGDIILSFAAWILERSAALGLTRLFFLARDGEIVKTAVDAILRRRTDLKIETHYLLASRRSLRVASMQTAEDVERDIDAAIDQYTRAKTRSDPLTFLSSRFGLDSHHLTVIDEHGTLTGLKHSTAEHARDLLTRYCFTPIFVSSVLAQSKIERVAYLDYLQSKGIGSATDMAATAFVDIGHSGSLQSSLASLFGAKGTVGLYFATYDNIDDTLAAGEHQSYGFFRDRVSKSDQTDPYVRYALLIETMFLNSSPSLTKFETDFGPVFSSNDTVSRQKFSARLHSGAMRFVETALDVIARGYGHIDLKDLVGEPSAACSRLFSMFAQPSFRDALAFRGATIENDFAGRPPRHLVPTNPKLTRDFIWKEGGAALRRHWGAGPAAEPSATPPTPLPPIERLLVAATTYKRHAKYHKYLQSPGKYFMDSKIRLLRWYGRNRDRFVK